MPVMRTRAFILVLCVAPSLLAAQSRPRSRDGEESSVTKPVVSAADATTFAGGDLIYAAPQGEFMNYVHGAVGVGGHFLQVLDTDGIIAFRADVSILTYGSRTVRQPLGGGALGLISADVTTSNNILNGGIGLQLMVPRGTVRPYLNGSLGFSYFWTQSEVAGSSSTNVPFASTQNFSDGGFSTAYGGGLYIPLGTKASPFTLDIGGQMHKNADIQYLTKSSITFTSSSAPPTITPVRSAADFITWRIGVTIAIR
jgi:hypothetical protein